MGHAYVTVAAADAREFFCSVNQLQLRFHLATTTRDSSQICRRGLVAYVAVLLRCSVMPPMGAQGEILQCANFAPPPDASERFKALLFWFALSAIFLMLELLLVGRASYSGTNWWLTTWSQRRLAGRQKILQEWPHLAPAAPTAMLMCIWSSRIMKCWCAVLCFLTVLFSWAPVYVCEWFINIVQPLLNERSASVNAPTNFEGLPSRPAVQSSAVLDVLW